MGQLPQVQKLFDAQKDKGLRLFQILTREVKTADLKRILSANGITYTDVLFKGNDFDSYPIEGPLPVVYVIGPDGKVKWQGDRTDGMAYTKVVEREIARIKYPGLGKLGIAKGLEKAATAFSKKQYAKAIKEANKRLEGEPSEAVAGDARYIIDRADAVATRLNARAKDAGESRHYLDAISALERIIKGFKGHEHAKKAVAQLKKLRKDKLVKAELKAAKALRKLRDSLGKMKSDAERAKALRKFYRKNKGSQAAEDAKADAEGLR